MNNFIKYFLVVAATMFCTVIALLIFDMNTDRNKNGTDKQVKGLSTISNKPTVQVLKPTDIPTPTLIPVPTATPSPTLIPAPTVIPTPVVTSDRGLEELFIKYSSTFSIDKNLIEKIANCESHFGTGAKNGPYAGMFQFDLPIWTSTRNLMGLDPNPDLRYSAEESIKTAAFLISQNHKTLWPVCGK